MKIFTLSRWYIITVIICYKMIPVLHDQQKKKMYCDVNGKTHNRFNRFLHESWKDIVEWGRPQMTIWRMCIACWIPKATDTHTHTHNM